MRILNCIAIMTLLFSVHAVAEDVKYDIHEPDSAWDTMKLKASPRAYWNDRVEDLEWSVKFGKSTVRDLLLERRKLLATKNLELAQAVNFAHSIDEDPIAARKEAWYRIKDKLQSLQDEVRFQNRLLARDQTWLETARKELMVLR
jgi:hypothetical protein